MAVYTESQRPLEFLLSEAPGTLSRDSVTLAAGSGVVVAGTVLGKITASGKYKPYDDNNADGSETATAVALMTVDATSADAPCGVLARLAEVKADALQWAVSVTAGEKPTALADLATQFIIAR